MMGLSLWLVAAQLCLLRAPATKDSCESKAPKDPGFRKDTGVFLVRGKPKERGQITAQHNRQFGLAGRERISAMHKIPRPGREPKPARPVHTRRAWIRARVESWALFGSRCVFLILSMSLQS
jgi:hypothetical protein